MGSHRRTGGERRERKQENRMTDSKSGSKDNLNESNMPLLEGEEKAGEETPEKEVVEMELEEKEEKKDESTEKKEKKEKVKKEPGPSCIDTLSSGLDLGARDSQ